MIPGQELRPQRDLPFSRNYARSFGRRIVALLVQIAVAMRRSLVLCSVLGLLSSLGCEAESGPRRPAPDSHLPCDVDSVLERNCRRCHADTPRFGAPMSLLTHEDTQAPAVSDDTRKVYELMAERIHSVDDPMPPRDVLSDEDKAILDAWFNESVPMRAQIDRCEGKDDEQSGATRTGIDDIDCTPTHSFTAHAPNSEEGFEVPVDAGNLYQCFTWRAPFHDDEQATAWRPVIDDERVIHHWILYSTHVPQEEGAAINCRMPTDIEFLAGWAPGGDPTVLPPDVGLELPGQDEFLILQVHYWNAAGLTDAKDRSGIELCTTETPRENAAGVVSLGALAIDIPPRTTGHEVTANCTRSAMRRTGDINVLGTSPHMHRRGRRLHTMILREGREDDVDMLIDVPNFSFDDQGQYLFDPPLVLGPTDVLRTTCTYDNDGDEHVRFGEKTEDEMCFNFVMVYPIPEINFPMRACIF